MDREVCFRRQAQQVESLFYSFSKILAVNTNVVPCFIPEKETRMTKQALRNNQGKKKKKKEKKNKVWVGMRSGGKVTRKGKATHESPVPKMSNSRWVQERSDSGV